MTPNQIAHRCWFLTGPTASGKTAIGLELAERLDAEIISLDSMAIYRGMDIGTAKPTVEQRQLVPHHLIDIRNPNERFSVSNYLELATKMIDKIHQRGRTVLFVGGTPLYLKTLLRGLFEGPPADETLRQEVLKEAAETGSAALHQRLAMVDPVSAAKIHPNDLRRIVRALEVYRHTGEPISHQQLQFDDGHPATACRVFVLDWPRAKLHNRINQRVDQMFDQGLVGEVEQLLNLHGELSRTALQAVGYQEVVKHLQQGVPLEKTIQDTKTRTRQFAKRQLTWFRSLGECRWEPRADEICEEKTATRILQAGSTLTPNP